MVWWVPRRLRVMFTPPSPPPQPSTNSAGTECVSSGPPVNRQVGAGLLRAFWSRVLFQNLPVPRPADSFLLPLNPRGATWPPALPVSLRSRNALKTLTPSEEATCDVFRQWPASASSPAGQRLCVTPHPSPGAARGTAERPAKKSGGVRDATSVTRRQDFPINEIYFVGNSFAGFN